MSRAVALLVASIAFPLSAQDDTDAPEPSPDPGLAQLAREFYAWLDVHRPVVPFAALRVPRPEGWEPDWSQTSLQQRRVEYLQFQGRLDAVGTLGFGTADRIDAAMLGSAMERMHWQLEVLASPRRDPGFYIDQTLGAVFEVLVRSPEPTAADIGEIIRRLQRFTALVNSAKLNLDRVVPLLAEGTISRIGEVDSRISGLESALEPLVPDAMQSDFAIGIRAARQSLVSYKDWLTLSLQRFNEPAGIGLQRYRWYLGYVAMVPRPPEALLIESEIVLSSVGARLAVVRHRHDEGSASSGLDSVARLVQMSAINQQELGAFLEAATLISPANSAVTEFGIAPLPSALAALADIGEAINLTASGEQPVRRYVHDQRKAADYIESLAWTDPRLLIAWDGIPGRYTQFRVAADNPRPIRRRSIDPGLSEGIALYFHQQIMEAGLYSFSPASLQLALSVLRCRAALAQADIRLAGGEWSVEDAVDFLANSGGLSRRRAATEVRGLVANPGNAGAAFAAYGQAVRFLADAAGAMGGEFSLTAFNDALLRNAHVPVALQRWEYLGFEDELDQLVEQRGRPATVPE